MMYTKFLILFTFVIMIFTVCSADGKASGADKYWSVFRNAVIENDKEKIVSMTRLPFVVRGPDDSDPIKKMERKAFLDIYERLVVQQIYLPSNGNFISKSMRELISEKKRIEPSDFLTPKSIQIYQFEFELIDGQWKFVRAYLEE